MIDGKGTSTTSFGAVPHQCGAAVPVRPGEYFFGYKYFAKDNSDMSEAEGEAYKARHERYRKAGFSTSMADPLRRRRCRPSIRRASKAVEDDEIQY